MGKFGWRSGKVIAQSAKLKPEATDFVIDFSNCSTTAVPEDNAASPTKAGSIKIKTPAGATAYINYYDGTRG